MKFFKLIFYPPFVQKLDRKLLITQPNLWTTRVHRVVWILLVSTVILTGYYGVVSNDARESSTVYLPMMLMSLFSLIGLVFWMIYLLRFNTFKRFGSQSPGSFLMEYLAYLIVVFLFVCLPFIPFFVESIRADVEFEYDEIVQETNEMNFLAASLYFNSLDKNWSRDTLYVTNYIAPRVNDEIDANLLPAESEYIDGKHFVTPSEMKRIQSDSDSIIALSDKIFIKLSAPDYRFINADKALENASTTPQTPLQMYRRVIKGQENPQPQKWQTEFNRLKEKYHNESKDGPYNYYDYADDVPAFINKLGLSSIQDGVDNISERKNILLTKNLPTYFRIAFYLSLFFSLLVFIFRHSTIKTFFIGILSIFVVSILTGILIGIIKPAITSIYITLLGYYTLFTLLILRVFSASKRRLVTGVAINAFTFLSVFIPIICLAYYYEYQSLDATYTLVENTPSAADIEFKEWMFVAAEIAGFAVLLLLVPSFIYKSYRKWFSLPEE
jgi:hypothetical protein